MLKNVKKQHKHKLRIINQKQGNTMLEKKNKKPTQNHKNCFRKSTFSPFL